MMLPISGEICGYQLFIGYYSLKPMVSGWDHKPVMEIIQINHIINIKLMSTAIDYHINNKW